MRIFFLVFSIISLTIFLSPIFSLYQIGNGIKDKDREILNGYILWDDLQSSVKKDVRKILKKRAKKRQKDLDNPIEGIFEDIKRVGEKVFGRTALDIAIDKVITPDGIIKLVELSERKKLRIKSVQTSNEENIKKEKNDKMLFNLEGYSLETFKFNNIKDFEAKIITPDGDLFFKMRLIFPRWHLYSIKSDVLSNKIAKKIEDSLDLFKNLKKGYEK